MLAQGSPGCSEAGGAWGGQLGLQPAAGAGSSRRPGPITETGQAARAGRRVLEDSVRTQKEFLAYKEEGKQRVSLLGATSQGRAGETGTRKARRVRYVCVTGQSSTERLVT